MSLTLRDVFLSPDILLAALFGLFKSHFICRAQRPSHSNYTQQYAKYTFKQQEVPKYSTTIQFYF